MRSRSLVHLSVLVAGAVLSHAGEPARSTGAGRTLPGTQPGHPGNVFLAGEEVVVPVSSPAATEWRLLNDRDRPLASFSVANGTLSLGKPGVGWYRLRPAAEPSGTNWISLAVLAPLKAPTPLSSPIGLDVAMAWFYPPEKMDAVASLCALAGVNRVRDRLHWGQMEPERGRFAGPGKYDASAEAQTRAGLQVLQVIHLSPAWANPETKRFPLDLRDAQRFYCEMARRWAGEVVAFEPWNEPDIDMFGGHTGAEIASLQKAAWLGLKAGNPKLSVALAVFALHNPAQLADLEASEAWPYFDTFDLHHYEPFENYPRLYADFRAVSAGRPLWTTEAALPVKWADAETQEPTDADLRVQAERIGQTFALALHERTVLFYFLLPHFVEGPTQFGLLRRDLTPRPGYVALAAVGRLLADAEPVGRLATGPDQRAYVFRARPGGEPCDVLVAWNAQGTSTLVLPVLPRAIFDYLGRDREPASNLELTSAPVFILLRKGTAGELPLTPPPAAPKRLKGAVSPVVLQALWPEKKTDLKQSAYRIGVSGATTVPVFAYNLGGRTTRGRWKVEGPAGWEVQFPTTVELAPDERKELRMSVTPIANPTPTPGTIRIVGDFGRLGRPVLSVRLLPQAE